MSTETIVIVGGGQAGGWAAQTLRTKGFAGRIVLVGDEAHRPYERPPLSKAVLSGHAMVESTYLQKPEAFEALQLDWRQNVGVTAIDRRSRTVRLTQGEPISYDKLILCTGGRARSLNIPGANLPGVFMLRSIKDAEKLGAALVADKRLLVIGGGWIGLEVASTARKKGLDVTIVEASERLCERTVPPGVSDYLLRLHTSHGVRVELGAGIERLAPSASGVLIAMLSDGREVEADVVLISVGLVANDELARAAGLACDGGVSVDSQCRTSDPDIFAAGDVAVWHSKWAGRHMRLESWQNAQEQGIAAACAVLGMDVDHQPLPWFWSDQFDVNLQIYGMPAPAHQTVLRGNANSNAFVMFFLDHGKVAAALGPNSARDLRFARRLIERGTLVDPALLADVEMPLSKL
ncbi:NAD(P)/FAD-dependent oxidoreductase [Variovorax sp. LG9.2]|jgi:3-phenylpropionate/trans-cinnamate dioxygenase ferredoxin reductase subunit|uniref:NAD(P)/FAD-dependent oxidoreductase n=1 Tax=Variovorax sp. LG9.2 TaxID=3048626 RepID=UPI002B23C326|nr:FAD-dependent oxidoreductase [Variovorax sp. LG9.2]MEB0057014.1 FAD-dependent oxidoreductase [Variovorax sp. LG9.2]